MKDSEKCSLRCVHPVDKNSRIAMAVDDESGIPIRFDLSLDDAGKLSFFIRDYLDSHSETLSGIPKVTGNK